MLASHGANAYIFFSLFPQVYHQQLPFSSPIALLAADKVVYFNTK